MHNADGVIFATPVYGLAVTGLMKTFIDRFSYIFHRPRFFDKRALLLTTTGLLGEKDVLRYLDTVAGIWGFDVVSRVGIVTNPVTIPERQARRNDRRLDEAARSFFQALVEGRERRPGLRNVIIFHGQRAWFIELADHARYWSISSNISPGIPSTHAKSAKTRSPYTSPNRNPSRSSRLRVRWRSASRPAR
ncbi:hypothetical protein MBOURGENBZM_15760 [Methanoculleus bourgensis]|nr:hypothetical protein MBOURGENBZM_15760 [Methanoculleus bourgensis]